MKMRWLWLVVAWCSLGLRAAGAVLPLLPTTPFVLIAAWAAPKASPRLRFWLYRHPRFGPPLRAWRRERAVAPRAKLSAVGVMVVSWISLWLLGAAPLLLGFVSVLFLAVASFLLSRPSPVRVSADH